MLLPLSAAAQGASLLSHLQQSSTQLWVDTAEVQSVKKFGEAGHITGVTMNPTLVWRAAKMARYFPFFQRAADTVYLQQQQAKQGSGESQRREPAAQASSLPAVDEMGQQLAVDFAAEALKHVPQGARACVQLDLRLADTNLFVSQAEEIMERCARAGITRPRESILIKMPATWEGLRATETLEKRGIRCLVTLVCSEAQGRAAAEAGATMLAVYVGRVADWHARAFGKPDGEGFAPEEDPGVALTARIYEDLRSVGAATEVMAASFRSVGQAAALAGRCHHLTIQPKLLAEVVDGDLQAESELASKWRRPTAGDAAVASSVGGSGVVREAFDEKSFTWALFRDKCGSQVTAKSITGFLEDTRALEMSFYKLAAARQQQL